MYRVLLVDDEYMILTGLKKIIDWPSLGFQVVATAENAMQGLSILENQKIDLVITDVTMPEMNGLEFIEAAQKEHHTFEFMILSGYQEFDYLKSGMQLGAVNYLMKPVNKAELSDSLRKVKQRLDQQNEQKNQQEIYQEVLFSQWLNEELDESSEEELLAKIGGEQRRILLAQLPRTMEKPVYEWLRNQQESFYSQRNFGEMLLFTLLLNETAISRFCRFIQNQCTDQEQATAEEQAIDFSSFSRSLQSGQLDVAQQMVTDFFEQFQTAVMTPEDIRHFSFLLFMDIQRELISLEDEEYFKGIQYINQAKTVQELHELLLSLIKAQQKQKKYSENVERVISILHEQFKEPLTLKDVSENLHLNVMYLGQLFKKETKKSFSAYLNHLRIEQAKWLLLHSNQNINEISAEIGYNNTTYFSKLFKKIVGKSPKDYREERG